MLTMNVDQLGDTCRPVMVLDLVLSSASFSYKRKKIEFILRNLVLCTIHSQVYKQLLHRKRSYDFLRVDFHCRVIVTCAQ